MTTEANRATKEVISGPPGPGLPFSTAIAYGDLVFVSGLVGRDPVTRQIAVGDVRAQTAQTLANVQAQLERAGSSLDRVLKATVFLTDMRLFGRMNEAYVAALRRRAAGAFLRGCDCPARRAGVGGDRGHRGKKLERSMRSYRIVYVDAFTATPLTGNPCAVLTDARGLTDAEMQAIAAETNLSETAFVLPSERADFRARYFTPRRELPFAGHPTIATAFTLAEEGLVKLAGPVTPLRLELGVGIIPVEIYSRDGKTPDRVVMTQQKPVFGPAFTAAETAPCFSLDVSELLTDPAPQVVSTGVPFLIVPVRDVAALQKVQMQPRRVGCAVCAGGGECGVYVLSRRVHRGGRHGGPAVRPARDKRGSLHRLGNRLPGGLRGAIRAAARPAPGRRAGTSPRPAGTRGAGDRGLAWRYPGCAARRGSRQEHGRPVARALMTTAEARRTRSPQKSPCLGVSVVRSSSLHFSFRIPPPHPRPPAPSPAPRAAYVRPTPPARPAGVPACVPRSWARGRG